MIKSYVKDLTDEQIRKIFEDLFGPTLFPGKDNEFKMIKKYDKQTDCLEVQAFDYICFWNISVYFHNDHFEIPKYKNGFSGIQNKKQQNKYLKSIFEIYGENYLNYLCKNYKNNLKKSLTENNNTFSLIQ